VTPSFFSILKIPPAIGRTFDDEEARASDGQLAVLSERAWRSRFGGDPTVLGQSLELDGQTYTVIGVTDVRLGLVMPSPDVFVPLMDDSGPEPMMVIGRRRGNVSWEQAGAELNALGVADGSEPLRVRVVPILKDAQYRTRIGWVGLVGPALLVLLISCANVGSLLLVQAAQREREMAVRLAMGAPRRRLATQLLIEGWILAVTAGALGLLLAIFGIWGVRALIPASAEIRPGFDMQTLLLLGAVSLLTPLLFGVAPLVHSLRLSVSDSLKAGLHKPLFGVGRYHLRDVFAILEVGLAMALVVLTVMFLSFFNEIRSMDVNFDGEGLVMAQISPRKDEPEIEALDKGTDTPRRLREQIAAVPGITHVTVSESPFGGASVRVGDSSSEVRIAASQMLVDRDYFGTLGLPILRGRGFLGSDATDALVAVVNESLAERLWPHADPVGQTLHVTDKRRTDIVTIVGVSKDAVRLGRLSGLDMRGLEFRYSLYRPWSQETLHRLNVIARVTGEPPSLFGPMLQAVDTADRRFHLDELVTMTSQLDLMDGEAPTTIYLLSVFGGQALLLATIGVFGVMRQLVNERQTEFGVRLALGASTKHLGRSVVRDCLIRVGIGAVLAVAGVSLGVRAGFPGLLWVSAVDPWLWLSIVAVVAATASAACYFPARRAGRTDPIEALRSE
jgi:predicted permease